MRKTIFITSVTRMDNEFVCVSGLDEHGKFVRPEIKYPGQRPGIKKEYLFDAAGIEVIKPMTKVELEFLKHIPKDIYHTEDWLIDGRIPPKLVAKPSDSECMRILNRSLDISLENALASQSRSLVLIEPKEMPKIYVEIYENRIECRFRFNDKAGNRVMNLPNGKRYPRVTDAYWLAFSKYLWQKDRQIIEAKLMQALKNKWLFLLVGITREWGPPGEEKHYWRQVSAVLTIPYWLTDRCFADFDYDFSDNV